jgi:hypothetical protein
MLTTLDMLCLAAANSKQYYQKPSSSDLLLEINKQNEEDVYQR